MSSEVGRRELHTRRGILNLKEYRGFLFLFFCLAVEGFSLYERMKEDFVSKKITAWWRMWDDEESNGGGRIGTLSVDN